MPTLEYLQAKHDQKMKAKTAKIKPEQRAIYIAPKGDGPNYSNHDWSHCGISRSYKKYRPGQSSTFPGRVNG